MILRLRVRFVQKIETLPIAERAKLIYEFGGKKHLTVPEYNVLHELGFFLPSLKLLRNFKEDTFYIALDELAAKMDEIKQMDLHYITV